MQSLDAPPCSADQGGAEHVQDGMYLEHAHDLRLLIMLQEMEVHAESKVYTHFF